jgi:subtilisin family serine protease
MTAPFNALTKLTTYHSVGGSDSHEGNEMVQNAQTIPYVRYALFEEEVPAGPSGKKVTGPTIAAAASKVTFLDADEAAAIRRPDTVLMRVPRMPVRLIPQVAPSRDAGGEPWGIQAVGADRCAIRGEGVCVAVLDTGIDAAHAAFAGLIREDNYRDFTNTGLRDTVGHGTHCAGIIFGRDVGGRRVAVAPGITQVIIGKIADRNFTTTTDQLEEALNWAVGQGADVISLSVGLDFLGHAKALEEAAIPHEAALIAALNDYRDYTRFFDRLMGRVITEGAASRSALVVAATGNDSHADGNPSYRIGATLPATAENVIAVGAIGKTADGAFFIAPFSNTGANLCAPGVGILSALPGNTYGVLSGTSQAAPHAAGVAALWWQKMRIERRQRPNPTDVASRMTGRATTDRLPSGASYDEIGLGLVEAPR